MSYWLYPILCHSRESFIMDNGTGPTAGATGWQGMLTPPRHLMPPPVFPGVRVSPFVYLTCNSYLNFENDYSSVSWPFHMKTLPMKGCIIYTYAWRPWLLKVEVFIAPHCYDTDGLFVRSHLNDCLIPSPLTTCEGMLKSNSIPDPQNH
jgi:hypothetical protein